MNDRHRFGNFPLFASYLLRVETLFVVYFALARIGFNFEAVRGFGALVWPPAGIAVASLILWGRGLWPGIFLGAFVVNLLAGAQVPVALTIGAGNTIEALIAATILL